MYVELRRSKTGQISYRISYYDEKGVKKRLPSEKHGAPFRSNEAAVEWVKTQSAHQEMMKYRIEKKLEWRKKFHDFEKLVLDFIPYYKDRAPNSYAHAEYHLNHYILPFFLTEKKAGSAAVVMQAQ